MASGLCAGDMRELLFSVKRDDFWDPGPGLGLLRGRKFRELLARHYVKDFADAKIPFSAVAFDMLALKTRFLESGPLPDAVAASCAVPLMFQPVRIGASLYLDGGVFHKSAIPTAGGRVLCVFLENEGLTGAYERRTTFPSLGPEHLVLRYRGLPKVDFYSLRGREEAYSDCYRRSKAAFGAWLESRILEV